MTSSHALLRPLFALALVLACGRTELPSPTSSDVSTDAAVTDAGRRDAGLDAGPIDAGADAGLDGGQIDPGPWVPKVCTSGRVTLIRPVPVVVLVVDGSGSMAEPFPDAPSKAVAVRGAMQNALPTWDPWMALGIIAFPTGQSCTVFSQGLVPPARGHLDQLMRWVGGKVGDSPTADTLQTAHLDLVARRASNAARQMVLVTDGFPTCNNGLDPTTCRCDQQNCLPTDCLDDERTEQRIAAAATSGVPTWVIGVDTADAGLGPVLNRFAEAGGHARTMPDGRSYLRATSGHLVGQHLLDVRDRMLRCSFITPSVPGRDDGIEMLVGGTVVPRDGTHGWSWVDRVNGELALRGAACAARLANPMRAVEAVVRCP